MIGKYNLKYFLEKSWSFVLMKNGKIIFKSKAERLKPLVFCVKKHKKEMCGAIVFDKVVGRAAAILLSHAKVKEIWTSTVSADGKKYLLKSKIKITYNKEVKNIMNRKGNDACPMEKISGELGSAVFLKYILAK